MLCTANDLLGWKDFPNGLSVLLLEEDTSFASQMKSRLEEMKYIVSWFQTENEALLAITSKSMQFHVAIVEVNTSNSNEVYRFLETAKDLPTILMSNVHCLSTMMKCIALGAVEFVQKPLSDDKLRNIWQHALHKAFNADGKGASELLKPVKESLVSMQQIQCSNESEQSNTSAQENKCPAPSTPQLKQGARSTDDQTQDSSMEQEGECKFVETTFSDSVFETTPPGEDIVKRERDSSPEQGQNGHSSRPERSKDARANRKKPLAVNASSETTKGYKKKLKVDWTTELHKKFVQAVEQLGLDQAIPSRILELMKVEGLTRHNVASHLQKYRMHRRQILPKQDERRWLISRAPTQRPCYPQNLPVMPFPQYHHSTNAVPAGQFYPAHWVHPGSYPGGPVWGSPYPYPQWQRPEGWNWKPNAPGVYGHAWGCPIVPPPQGPYPTYPQSSTGNCASSSSQDRFNMLGKAFDVHPAEEVIDRVVKEAINNPWLPLPLGLNPPSTESVLNELSKQGISTIPPLFNGSDSR